MPRSLADRVIIITGASSGIGKAAAVECARAGMDVVISARRPDRLAETADAVRAQGRRAEMMVGDVTDPGHSDALLDLAAAGFRRLDAVFANAGYGQEVSTVEMPEADLRRMFEVNFFAAVDLLQKAARRWREAHSQGHLLMNASCVARLTIPYYAAYAATKAAQVHVCRAMGLELKADRIDVSCMMPVTTVTEFHHVATTMGGQPAPTSAVPEHAPRLFVQRPEKVARAVVRCLRSPRPEVWTSHIVRLTSGLFTMFPQLLDLAMGGETRRRRPIVEPTRRASARD